MGSHKGHQASVMIMDMENVRFFLKVPDPLQRGDLKTEKTFLFIPVRVPGEWIQIDAGAVKPGGYIDQDKVEAQVRFYHFIYTIGKRGAAKRRTFLMEQIGRASCRERGWISEETGAVR